MSSKKSDIPAASAVPLPPLDAGGLSTKSGLVPSLLANGTVLLLLPVALLAFYWLVEKSDLIDLYYARIVTLVGFNIILAVGLQLINGYSGQFSLGHAGFMAVGAYLAAYPAKTHGHLGEGFDALRRIDHPFGVLLFYLNLGCVLVVAGAALGAYVQAMRATRRFHPQLPGVLVLASVGWILWDVAQAQKFDRPPGYFVWSGAIKLLVTAYDWLAGTFAPAALWLTEFLPEPARQPLCFVFLVVGGGAFAAMTGLVVGIPTLRLRGDYLAIATLGLGVIIVSLIRSSRPLGEALGLNSIPKYTDTAWLYAFVAIAVLVVWRLAYSARGRLIEAVREDEIASAAVGVHATSQKVLAFVVGAFFGGVAGALFAMNERSITPEYFGPKASIEAVVIVTLGGLRSISGTIVAAIVLTLLPELLRPVADYRMIIYALLLVVMMLVRPQGLLGGRELWPKRWGSRRRFANRPDEGPSAAADAKTDGGATLEARHLSRRFGGLTALSDFSLTIAPGELVGLIGPNGAGKTTAFNVVTGVYPPSDGQVLLGDQRIDGLSPVWINRHGVARTFQNIRLFKDLSVLDNVAVALKNRRELSLWRTLLRTPTFYRERAASESRALDLLRTMSLSHLADQPAGSLPYGDQRRLEIARALATGPRILLLDEPAAGMNPQEKLALMDLIRFVRDRFAVGILLIEHDMKLVMNVCQRITVLDHGETIAIGTPSEVQANPKVIEAYLGEPGDVE